MKNSSGSWTNTSPSWGSWDGGKIVFSPENGSKNGALTPPSASSSWHSASRISATTA